MNADEQSSLIQLRIEIRLLSPEAAPAMARASCKQHLSTAGRDMDCQLASGALEGRSGVPMIFTTTAFASGPSSCTINIFRGQASELLLKSSELVSRFTQRNSRSAAHGAKKRK